MSHLPPQVEAVVAAVEQYSARGARFQATTGMSKEEEEREGRKVGTANIRHKEHEEQATNEGKALNFGASKLVLRFEPFTLACECRTAAHAHALVACGLEAGMRESGVTASSNVSKQGLKRCCC